VIPSLICGDAHALIRSCVHPFGDARKDNSALASAWHPLGAPFVVLPRPLGALIFGARPQLRDLDLGRARQLADIAAAPRGTPRAPLARRHARSLCTSFSKCAARSAVRAPAHARARAPLTLPGVCRYRSSIASEARPRLPPTSPPR
jgi:hypothetical protein